MTGISGGGLALVLTLCAGSVPLWLHAEEARRFQLAVPGDLAASGLLDYLLPRFSLKTQVQVTVVAAGTPAEAALGRQPDHAGVAVFADPGGAWHLAVLAEDHAGAERFADWLTSDVGLRTVLAYAPEGIPLFAAPKPPEEDRSAPRLAGDGGLGQELSLRHCGRCHVVSEANRMQAIGSTPSFASLRGFDDWEERFSAFFVLKPHGAFTRIDEVTEPFDATRPPAIVPVEMTLEELDHILAYVAALAPADLGQPLELK